MNRPLHRFALFTAFATLCLLVAGALVTSNEAGLSVPDWPLSYGQWMPPLIGGVFYEHGHRMIASLVGLLTVILAVRLWRAESRAWVKKIGLAAVVAVIAQGVLGGMTVLFLLPTALSVGHACLAQLFFCMIVSLALVTSPGWQSQGADRLRPLADGGMFSLARLTVAVNVAIFLQLMLGAAFRHKGMGVVPHLIGAGVVALLVIWVVVRVAAQHAARREVLGWTLVLNGLLVLQLVLGAAAYWIRHVTATAPQPLPPMVALTVTHVAVGALLMAAGVVLTIQVHARLGDRTADMNRQELPRAI